MIRSAGSRQVDRHGSPDQARRGAVGWDVKWCPVSSMFNALKTQKKVSLDFEEEKALNSITYRNLIVAAVTRLEYYRYGGKR